MELTPQRDGKYFCVGRLAYKGVHVATSRESVRRRVPPKVLRKTNMQRRTVSEVTGASSSRQRVLRLHLGLTRSATLGRAASDVDVRLLVLDSVGGLNWFPRLALGTPPQNGK